MILKYNHPKIDTWDFNSNCFCCYSLYEEFLSTTYMLSYQLHVLEDGELRVQDILYEEQILFYFLEV